MDFKLFFSPIDSECFEGINSNQSFFKSIDVHAEKMPTVDEVDIALIGLSEDRGTDTNTGVSKAANEIRKKLYNLKKGTGQYRIVDLGDLRNGIELSETYLRIREVCHALMEMNVMPVLIGSSHDQDYGQYQAYEDLEKLVTVLSIDSKFDMDDSKTNSRNHMKKILLHDPNYLFHFSNIGYQSYLVDATMTGTLEKLHFDAYRLGHFRKNVEDMEPVIRDADMLSFDISAIKQNDAPGNANSQPFGLTGEEACQICWYAGLNDKLSSAGFYEYNPALDDENKKTAAVTSIMIWYLIEGFYNRKSERNFKTSDYVKYVAAFSTEPTEIVFYKSQLSEKWWMEVPFEDGLEKTVFDLPGRERKRIVPCSYSDYETATKGELPDRWINYHSK